MDTRGVSSEAISRYFSGQGSGASVESNFGVMCERASSLNSKHASVRCRHCGGKGCVELSADELVARWRRIAELEEAVGAEKNVDKRDELRVRQQELRRELSRESDCSVCRGSGYTTKKQARRGVSDEDRSWAMDTTWTTVPCRACHGCGESFPPTDETAELGDVCQSCGADGYWVPVTVRETGSSKSGKAPHRHAGAEWAEGDPIIPRGPAEVTATASWVDEDEMAEHGRISRVIESVRRVDPVVAMAIEAFNGSDGHEWGRHKWGRLFSLWQLTEAGQALARIGAERSTAAHGLKIRVLDLIAAERDAEERAQTPDRVRIRLIKEADLQARELKSRMDDELAEASVAA